MSKAYDWVEWDFVKAIMRHMGFSQAWVSLIIHYARSISYSVLMNGERGSSFILG